MQPTTPTSVERDQRLTPATVSLVRLANLVSDRDVDVADVVEVIEVDPALTGGILRTANSASSASANPVGTVRDAVVRLGFAPVLAVALGGALAGRHSGRGTGRGGKGRELWAHSARALFAAQEVGDAAVVRLPSVLATAALLHDVGRTEVEIDHGARSADIVASWGLSAEARDAIRCHHEPSCSATPLTWGVVLADLAAHRSADEDADAALIEAALTEMHITPGALDVIVTRVADKYEWLAERFDGAH